MPPYVVVEWLLYYKNFSPNELHDIEYMLSWICLPWQFQCQELDWNYSTESTRPGIDLTDLVSAEIILLAVTISSWALAKLGIIIDSRTINEVCLAKLKTFFGCSSWMNWENMLIMPKTDIPRKSPRYPPMFATKVSRL